MNITRYLAEQTASKMVAPIQTRIDETQKKITDLADMTIASNLKVDLVRAYGSFRSYFSTSVRVTFKLGEVELRIDGVSEYPIPAGNWTSIVPISKEAYETLYSLTLKKKKMQDEKAKTYSSLVATLLELKTFKRVKDNFPEAYLLIEDVEREEKTTALTVPRETILATLESYK